MSEWVELRLRAPARNYAKLESVLEGLGASAITTSEGDTEVFGEPGVPTDREWETFTVTALFEASANRDIIIKRLAPFIGPDANPVFAELVEQSWADSWKDHWQPQGFANDLWVCPTWCEPPPEARQLFRSRPGGAGAATARSRASFTMPGVIAVGSSSGARARSAG